MPLSPGKGKDDLILPDLNHFRERQVVLTEKMDGENTTFTREGVYARSLNSRHHESRSWVKDLWGRIRFDIPEGWRICGENLYAQHSIAYDKLPSYFLVFAIFNESNYSLSWLDVCTFASLLGLNTVPEISRPTFFDENEVYSQARTVVQQGGEGLVIRFLRGYHFVSYYWSQAKYVRAGHVITSKHWMYEAIAPNKLAA